MSKELTKNAIKAKAFDILKQCMFKVDTDGLSYWLESPLFNGNKLLLIKEEYDFLKNMDEELIPNPVIAVSVRGE